ncbi:rhomboid family intramembrane serine protease [Anoxybacteroides tepidamans]|uniref:rhomboid family intramembrane serine protease n=1 Tax=Anoxybacteroides tepidamans TaxID=265948 RepID=UPI000484B6A4|nr:rhomboid family intramembrane serine protease [Anoxybacillus tepidamans]
MELFYWQLVHFFVKRQYRIIKLSNAPHEIWLESFDYKDVPLIRLVRHDIDWGSWLQRDIEYTRQVVGQLRKRYMKRSFQVLNLYVSTYPPVDDWEWIVANQEDRITLKTMLIHSANTLESLRRISEMIREPVLLPKVERFEDPFAAVQHIQRRIFYLERERQEKEKRLLEYGKPLFTYALIVLQVLMFLVLEWQGGSRNPEVLIEYGAKFNPLIKAGEWWRLITPIFLHIGFFHLFMNTMALYYLGMTAERLYGSWRFLFIYLYGGFFGTLASFLFTTSLSAGASGAIFGLFGALLYFGTVHRHLFFQTMGANIIGLVALNLGLGLLIPNIDNAGHIGGLIGGFLAASIVHLPRHRRSGKQFFSLLITFVLTAVCLYIGMR